MAHRSASHFLPLGVFIQSRMQRQTTSEEPNTIVKPFMCSMIRQPLLAAWRAPPKQDRSTCHYYHKKKNYCSHICLFFIVVNQFYACYRIRRISRRGVFQRGQDTTEHGRPKGQLRHVEEIPRQLVAPLPVFLFRLVRLTNHNAPHRSLIIFVSLFTVSTSLAMLSCC